MKDGRTHRLPAHIRRVRAGDQSRGVTTPVSLVYLPVSLTGPDPSGSARPTRLRRGCSHPPRQLPAPAASSFYPTATTAGQWRSFTSIRNNSASRRTFCLVTDLLDHHTHPAHLLAAGLPVAVGRLRDRAAGGQVGHPRRRPGHRGDPALGHPELIRQEHAAWIAATELVHAATRSAAAIAQPFRKGPRTGQPVAARHLSFTTARRTLIATVRAGDRHRLAARTRSGRRPPPRPGRDRHRPRHHRSPRSPTTSSPPRSNSPRPTRNAGRSNCPSTKSKSTKPGVIGCSDPAPRNW